MATVIEHGKTWEGFPYVSIVVEGYAFPDALDHYLIGIDPPNYPVPAIRQYSSWGNDIAYITIWPNVLQIRISDEYLHGDYTGFGAVVTFETDTGECQCRYDDFD